MSLASSSEKQSKSVAEDQLDFPPVRNGVDYLVSVVDHLRHEQFEEHLRSPRDLKYAVLHLQAAAEVLLKARLQRAHWSLVFKDPGTASLKKFREGDFESCGADATVLRLRQIVGVEISQRDQKALKDLAKDRNALQHYGLTHNAAAIEVRAGAVLDFLVRFLENELLPGLHRKERSAIRADWRHVAKEVRGITAFATQRIKRLVAEVKEEGVDECTVDCPFCQHLSMVIQAEIGGSCRFCESSVTTEHLIDAYYYNPDGAFSICPACKKATLGVEVQVLAREELQLFCFTCTYHQNDPEWLPSQRLGAE
ncbi:hypothetical protein [Streptomyces sp. BpilaLS-43]|uniref:hypothetical protein n=1 Tax=Streptomyces sp. BpilaLS-43 TaxID=1839778 RepID=UPI00114D0F47|nr:hypothetical protein [Streptomyces sp. BpilaLS-43]